MYPRRKPHIYYPPWIILIFSAGKHFKIKQRGIVECSLLTHISFQFKIWLSGGYYLLPHLFLLIGPRWALSSFFLVGYPNSFSPCSPRLLIVGDCGWHCSSSLTFYKSPISPIGNGYFDISRTSCLTIKDEVILITTKVDDTEFRVQSYTLVSFQNYLKKLENGAKRSDVMGTLVDFINACRMIE